MFPIELLQNAVLNNNLEEIQKGASQFGTEYKYLWLVRPQVKYKCLG
jgi:hypothetical protein